MSKKTPPGKSLEFVIDESNLEFVIEKVFENDPEMIKKLKDKLPKSERLKSDKPALFF